MGSTRRRSPYWQDLLRRVPLKSIFAAVLDDTAPPFTTPSLDTPDAAEKLREFTSLWVQVKPDKDVLTAMKASISDIYLGAIVRAAAEMRKPAVREITGRGFAAMDKTTEGISELGSCFVTFFEDVRHSQQEEFSFEDWKQLMRHLDQSRWLIAKFKANKTSPKPRSPRADPFSTYFIGELVRAHPGSFDL